MLLEVGSNGLLVLKHHSTLPLDLQASMKINPLMETNLEIIHSQFNLDHHIMVPTNSQHTLTET